MKSINLSALGLVLAVGILSGCSGSGSDNPPIVSNGPAAAIEDQRIPQSDALTAAEASQATQASTEPAPASKPDI